MMKGRKGGFTLVELIVVIAILAILAGVGTVAYSGYVKRANQAADEVLISEIKYALILGVQAGNFPEGDLGLVVVSTGGTEAKETAAEGAPVAQMMEDAFGADWEDALKLKTDMTGGSYADYAAMVNSVTGATSEYQGYNGAVPDSSFYTVGSTGDLMGEVADVVDSFSSALGTRGNVASAMTNLWGSEFKQMLSDSGISYSGLSTDDTSLAANLTVWAAANAITKADESQRNAWINSWAAGETPTVVGLSEGQAVAAAVLEYAQLNALAKYGASLGYDGVTRVYNDNLTALRTVTTREAFMNNLTNLKEQLEAEIPPVDVRAYYGENGQAKKDAQAFIATMAALNSLEGDYVSKDNLDNLTDTRFFDDEAIASKLSYFVTACSNADLLEGVSGGYVIFVGVGPDGQAVIS